MADCDALHARRLSSPPECAIIANMTPEVGARTPGSVSDMEPSPELIELMGDVAELALADLDQLVAAMNAAEIALVPALGADAGMVADLSASNRTNAARLLTTLARREARPAPIEVPPEALDAARTVARRGIDFDALFQGNRRGQNVAWEHYMEHATRVVLSGPLLLQLLRVSSRRMFGYVDH